MSEKSTFAGLTFLCAYHITNIKGVHFTLGLDLTLNWLAYFNMLKSDLVIHVKLSVPFKKRNTCYVIVFKPVLELVALIFPCSMKICNI